MIRLLNAGFLRLKKDRILKVLLGVVIVIALWMICTSYQDRKQLGIAVEVEQFIFNLATMFGIGLSVFISLFTGTEYSDGTIRNKLIVGNNRIKIYLSNFILMFIASVIIYGLFILVVCSIGIPLFGGITMPISEFVLRMIGIIGVISTYNAIFTFISMIIQNKTASSVSSILIAFSLIGISLILLNILSTPPTITIASITDSENGKVQYVQEPNPKYPTETERKAYQTMLDIIPVGQSFQIADKENKDFRVLPIYSLVITMTFTGLGLLIFQREDLK